MKILWYRERVDLPVECNGMLEEGIADFLNRNSHLFKGMDQSQTDWIYYWVPEVQAYIGFGWLSLG